MRRISGYMVMVAAVLVVLTATPGFAGEEVGPQQVQRPTAFGVTPPMSEYEAPAPAEGVENYEIPNHPVTELAIFPGATPPDQVMGEGFITLDSGVLAPAPNIGFDGNNSDDNQAIIGFRLAPPDTQGAVGMQYYVQWVNLTWSIYDKATGAEVVGPLPGSSLWAAGIPGTDCATFNNGDPITLYDHAAQRWFMSQFALDGSSNRTCMAVSQTSDPTGAWYVWEYTYGSLMNDYPKFGVWPDGYYMTVNEFGSGQSATTVFDRTAMLAGNPAPAAQYFSIDAVQPQFPQPTNWDGGPPPPAGAPNYNVAFYDDGWGNPVDLLAICEYHVDWATPANSTFTCPVNPGDPGYIDLTAAGLSFDSDLCGYSRNCIQQPGPQTVDSLSDRLMFPLNYRNLMSTLGYEVMTVTHSVDANGADQAGVRWYELRNTGAGWFIQDGGTFAPDSDSRWMGSSAVDQNGNIGLIYSISSSSTFPSVGYTARDVGDPPGTMQTEQVLVAGGGSQGAVNRWGDYAAMHVDPDGCTFWGTAEYVNTGGDWIWDTYIGSFSMPGCTPSGFGTVDGTVVNFNTMLPIEGALVEVGAYTTFTQADGTYAINVPEDTYDVTASAFGYTPQTVMGVVVTDGMTTVQDFALVPVGTADLDGYVTDDGHGWPLYAAILIETGGMPVATVFTDPFNGYYEVELPQGTAYNLTVYPGYPGYNPVGRSIVLAPPPGQTESFVLSPNAACEAPGYELLLPDAPETFTAGFPGTPAVPQPGGAHSLDVEAEFVPSTVPIDPRSAMPSGVLINDGSFENGPPPASAWTETTDTPCVWIGDFSATWGVAAYDGVFDFWGGGYCGAPNTNSVEQAITIPGGTLSFWYIAYRPDPDDPDADTAYITVDGTEVWSLDLIVANNTYPNWVNAMVDLSAWAGQTVNLKLGATSAGAQTGNILFDFLEFAISCEPIPGAIAVGFVSDANTFDAINGADVINDVGGATTTVPTPEDPNIPDGAYYLFTPLPTGDGPSTRTFTASADSYGDGVVVLNMVPETINQIDFALGAGWLELAPDHLESRLNWGMTEDQLVGVLNFGTLEANISLMTMERAPWVPSMPMDEIPQRDIPAVNLNDRTAAALPQVEAPAAAPLAAGDVINSWPHGLVFGWGLGVNKFADNVWVGNIAAGGGDDLDYEYTRAGSQTGKTIDTSSWAGVFAADMAFDPTTGMFWQLDVGGADCIHEWDPVSLTTTGSTICWGSPTSERGLAYDPVSDTFFVGGWNTTTVTRFDRSGTVLNVAAVGLGISGLAYNPVTEHLFVMTNAAPNLAYVLDVADNYNVIGTFPIPGFGDFSGGGLGFSCDGHLWAPNQGDAMVYEVDSGENAACIGGGGSLPWLVLTPDEGMVPPMNAEPGLLPINAEFIADGADHFGLFQATISVMHDTPYGVNDSTVCFTKAFDDVAPAFWADDFIHSLAGADISQGCGGADFCPTEVMIRNTMARWLVKAYHGPDFTPIPCAGTFADVVCEATPNSNYIEQIYADEITTGCGTDPLIFCPNDTVNRAQMATFITRLAYGPDFVPPPATGMMYPDVAPGLPGWWAADYIEWLTNEGIVEGFPDGLYRPLDPTSRAQMAKMVVISIDLPMCDVPE